MNEYERILDEMPAGLDRAVLRVLSQRIGQDKAIKGGELVAAVKLLGIKAHERQVRMTIKTLRREGHLICSLASERGGYYIARDRAEYDEFRQAEFAAKIIDMNETLRAMDKTAAVTFGQQIGLFN